MASNKNAVYRTNPFRGLDNVRVSGRWWNAIATSNYRETTSRRALFCFLRLFSFYFLFIVFFFIKALVCRRTVLKITDRPNDERCPLNPIIRLLFVSVFSQPDFWWLINGAEHSFLQITMYKTSVNVSNIKGKNLERCNVYISRRYFFILANIVFGSLAELPNIQRKG